DLGRGLQSPMIESLPPALREMLSEPHWPGPVGEALDLWASGRLTVTTFWRLALESRTHEQARQEWWADPTLSIDQERELSTQTHDLARQVEYDVPTLTTPKGPGPHRP